MAQKPTYTWREVRPIYEYWLCNSLDTAAVIKKIRSFEHPSPHLYMLEIYRKGGSSIFYFKKLDIAKKIGKMLQKYMIIYP